MADSINADSAAREAVLPAKEVHIHNLLVLPPRQQSNNSNKDAIALPPLRAEEAVASLRGALSEIVGFAHLTRFRLVVEKVADGVIHTSASVLSASVSANGGKQKKTAKSDTKSLTLDPVISRYTLRQAVVSVPPTLKTLDSATRQAHDEEETILDDFGDLSVFVGLIDPDEALSDDVKVVLNAGGKYAIRVVLVRYDMASVRDQIGRVRGLLAGNAPALKSLVMDDDEMTTTALDEAGGNTGAEKSREVEPPGATDKVSRFVGSMRL